MVSSEDAVWLDDPLLAGQVPELDRQVRFLMDTGQVADAEVAFGRITTQPSHVDSGWDAAVVLVHRALLALRLGNMPLTLELAIKGWDTLNTDHPHGTAPANAVSMFGYLLEAVGSYEPGLELITLSVQVARESEDPDTLALCLLREANARLVRAFYAADPDPTGLAAVLNLCEEALPLAAPGQTRRRLLNASAAAFVGLGSFEEAERRAAQSLESSRRAADYYTMSYANEAFAEIRWRQNRLHEARTFASRAVAEVHRTAEVRLWSLWSQTLASICRDLGDPVGESDALRHTVAAGTTTIRVLREGLGAAVDHRRLAIQAQRDEGNARRVAHRDPLTRLLNRRGLESQAPALFRQAAEHAGVPWLVLIDIDHFKEVNDRSGHAAGDRTLVELARLLLRECRTKDLVCRWAGDELVVLLLAEDDDAATAGPAVAERLRRAVGAHGWPFVIGSRPLTVSIGVSTGANELNPLFATADHALYRAKHAGRNRIQTEHAPPGS